MIGSRKSLHGLAAALALGAGAAQAQVSVDDTLTGASSSVDWQVFGGACMTAGNSTTTGQVPACGATDNLNSPAGNGTVVSIPQYGGVNGTLPDPVGQGALRLTNAGAYEKGGVVSNTSFPVSAGLQIVWTSVAYGGNGVNGGDGMSFFLADAAYPPNIGGVGGSLGYSCKNAISTGTTGGVIGGYIGIGMDEYGNFSSPGDNTASGPGGKPNRISVRGAGNIAYPWLSSTYSVLYPASLSAACQNMAVTMTCAHGLSNWSGNPQNVTINGITSNIAPAGPVGTCPTLQNTGQIAAAGSLPYDYNYLAGADLPPGTKIANQQNAGTAARRGSATPITYSLNITSNGHLSFSYSFNGGTPVTVMPDQDITASNGPLPASLRFGFVASTGAVTDIHEITCFKTAPASQSGSSAGSNVQSGQVQAGAQAYFAYYHQANWWGQLTAQNLVVDPVTGAVSISTTANWDADCVLTGGNCQATGVPVSAAQGSASRTMLTFSGSSGIPFEWGNLTSAQQTSLSTNGANGQQILSYLRGDRSQEASAGNPNGTLRQRTGVLGDIIDSGPTWVGPPALPYATTTWGDLIQPGDTAPEVANGAQTYPNFTTAYQGRQNVVYVGANDGFLHGFRAGSYAGGNFTANSATPNDGSEALAYMPSAVLASIQSPPLSLLEYAALDYSHNDYVDATPGTGDLFYSGAWHTWLVGGTGPGGNPTGPVANDTSVSQGTIYALDITDPGTFTEGNASSIVKGEWTSSTITCTGTANCGNYLGATYGTPIIRRLHNGMWAALFGNGLNSANGSAGLFIMMVDSSGSITFRYIDTGAGPLGGAKNGIVTVASADLDGDHIIDYVYAGDVQGHLWRFDLTSNSASDWNVWTTPLFTTPNNQPITTGVLVSSVPMGSQGNGVVVAFGTGQQLPQTQTQGVQYASGQQALYGIWDWNMTAWNGPPINSSTKYLTASPPPTPVPLQTQAITADGTLVAGDSTNYRTVSASAVCWQGTSVCPSNNNLYGWTLPLTGTNEQIVFNPTMVDGMFVVNTTIPSVNSVLSCTTQLASGYTMAVSMGTGGAPSQPFLSTVGGSFTTGGSGIISGVGLNAVGTAMTAGKNLYSAAITGGATSVLQFNGDEPSGGQRLTWIQLR